MENNPFWKEVFMSYREKTSHFNYDDENVNNVLDLIENEDEDDFAFTLIQKNSYNEAVLHRENANIGASILID